MIDSSVIRQSLAGFADRGSQKCASDFYSRLFSSCPHVRGMFPAQMTGQNERLFGALIKIVQLLDQPDSLYQFLTQLGADHRKYGVQPEHYAPVGDALIRALREHSTAWSQGAEASWSAAYSLAADWMVAGAQAQTGPAFWRGRVVRHERRTRDLAVLTVRTDEPMPYQAGQYVTVQAGKWPQVWRPFSIANAPRGDGEIDFHVRAVSGGWVSTALVRDTALDHELLIGPAVGCMTQEAVDGRDLLCVAGGTGLAPLKALTEAVLAADEDAVAAGTGHRRNIHLMHGARSPLELYDMPDLRELAASYPWLRVVPVVSGDPDFTGLRGDVADITLDYGDWSDRDAFISGPAEMTRCTARGLMGAGLQSSQVHFDDQELSGVG